MKNSTIADVAWARFNGVNTGELSNYFGKDLDFILVAINVGKMRAEQSKLIWDHLCRGNKSLQMLLAARVAAEPELLQCLPDDLRKSVGLRILTDRERDDARPRRSKRKATQPDRHANKNAPRGEEIPPAQSTSPMHQPWTEPRLMQALLDLLS